MRKAVLIIFLAVIILLVIIGFIQIFIINKAAVEREKQIEAVTVQPQQDSSPVAIGETASGSRLYRNDKYAFEFVLPDGCEVTYSKDNLPAPQALALLLGYPELFDDLVWINVYNDISLPAAFDLQSSGYPEGFLQVVREELIFVHNEKGKVFYLKVGDDGEDIRRWVFAPFGGRIYAFGLSTSEDSYKQEFDQLIASFKFIE